MEVYPHITGLRELKPAIESNGGFTDVASEPYTGRKWFTVHE